MFPLISNTVQNVILMRSVKIFGIEMQLAPLFNECIYCIQLFGPFTGGGEAGPASDSRSKIDRDKRIRTLM